MLSNADARHVHVIPLGKWELRGTTLTPTRCTLQAHATHLQSQQATDPIVEITLQSPVSDAVHKFKLHRSLLQAASPPLSALVENPDTTVKEFHDTFAIIRKFLYLEPIDLANVTADLPLAAARWRLPVLHHAIFAYAERYQVTGIHILWKWIPVLKVVPVPESFKTVVALAFVTLLSEGVETKWLHSEGRWGDWRCVPDENAQFPKITCLCKDQNHTGADDKLPKCAIRNLEHVQHQHALAVAKQLRIRVDANSSICAEGSPPCGQGNSIWQVFHNQNMLLEVVRYMVMFGLQDNGPLLLDVILRQLEPQLTDSQILSLLRTLSWHDSYTEIMHGELPRKWTVRGYQLLIRSKESSQSGYEETRVGIVLGALKKALPEPGVRTVLWQSEPRRFVVDNINIPLVLSVQCSSRKNKRLPPLQATIKTPIEAKAIPRCLVRMQVAVVESHCGCTLRQSDEAYAGWTIPVESEIPITSFAKVGGVPMKLMEGHALRKWIDSHEAKCSLTIVVRLRVRRESRVVEEKKEDENRGRWRQDWQLKCDCGSCHQNIVRVDNSNAMAID